MTQQQSETVGEAWALSAHKIVAVFLADHFDKNWQELKEQRKGKKTKISMLPRSQFTELAIDVTDEIDRRKTQQQNAGGFLPVNSDFNTRRNQARQKLATLNSQRFQELATDVYFELEIRFSLPQDQPLPPPSSQQTPAQRQKEQKLELNSGSNLLNLNALMHDLDHEIGLKEKKTAQQSTPGTIPQQLLQNRIEEANFRNLETKIKQLETENAAMHRYKSQAINLEKNLQDQNITTNKLNADYEIMVAENKKLRELTLRLQSAIERASDWSKAVESERDSLSLALGKSEEHSRRLLDKLTESVEALHNLENMSKKNSESSIGVKNSDNSASSTNDKKFAEVNPNVVSSEQKLSHVLMCSYHSLLSAFLQAFAQRAHTEVLENMKGIVHCCRAITEKIDLECKPQSMKKADQDELAENKAQLSVCLTRLMDAVKSSSTFNNNKNTQNNNGSGIGNSNGQGNGNSNNQVSSADQILHISIQMHSEALTKTVTVLTGILERLGGEGVEFNRNHVGWPEKEHFKTHLGIQSAQIVGEIQSILCAMRESSFGSSFEKTVSRVSFTVDNILKSCRDALAAEPQPKKLSKEASMLLANLRSSNTRLCTLAQQICIDPTGKDAKQNLANASYEVAKYTRDLHALLD